MKTSSKIGFASIALFFVALSAVYFFRTRVSPLSSEASDIPASALKNKFLDTDEDLPIAPIEISASADPLAIEGEAVVVFGDTESYETFLQSIENSDLELISKNAKLLAVRLRYSDFDTFAQATSGVRTEANFTLLAPMPIADSVSSAGANFGNSALQFLNVPFDNSEWGSGIRIAVLDSGIGNHTTLSQANIIRANGSTSAFFHGTAVASLIAGKDGNGIAPAATLIDIPVLDSDGIGDVFSLAESIIEAVDEGANIINLSIGSYSTNTALDRAIDYANSAGVVLVASAGNDSLGLLPYPAAYEGVISVASIDAEGHPTNFSNQSDSLTLSAPGTGVYAAWGEEEWVSFSGTSASAPYVAGAIAALASQIPNTSVRDAANLLVESTSDTGLPGYDPQTGNGYPDLTRTIALASGDYNDLALADIYLDAANETGGYYTVYITAQNRGSSNLASTSVEITLMNGVTQNTYLGPLAAGESAYHAINISELELSSDGGYTITAKVRSAAETNDENGLNDQRSVTLSKPDQ